MNRRILQLAIPNIISNITIPLLGLISIAMAGNLGSDNAIAAINIGSMIFSFIYWNCAFVRMGTSGMAAQAFGARNFAECANILVRSLVVAWGLAALILSLQGPIGRFGMQVMGESHDVNAMVGQYFYARIWAAPATISHYAIQGWFIGMQNSRLPMFISISINVLSVIFGYTFVYVFDMGVAGIAYGVVVAQYMGIIFSVILWWKYYRRFAKYINWKESLRWKPLLRFFNINKDIFIRTFCNTLVYTFFPFAAAKLGVTMLTTNAILIQLFTLFSYIADGFGYAAEALVGKFTGAKNKAALSLAVRNMFGWSAGIAVVFVIIYLLFWPQILSLFNASPEVVASVKNYIGWIIVVPLLAFTPFLMDGILIGATKTKILRNSMFISTVIFFVVYYAFVGTLGNTAMWLAFVIFLASRGINQLIMTKGLKGLLWDAPAA